MKTISQNAWGFSEIWNESLLKIEQRPASKRDNLWASELGKAPIDLWLKLSVLASAITSAVWSFCGYKFIVFKK